MVSAILNKLSSGAVVGLLALIILSGTAVAGYAVHKGCNLDVGAGIKISGCTGVMTAFNTDGSGESSTGTMLAGLGQLHKDKQAAEEAASAEEISVSEPVEVAAVVAPAPVALSALKAEKSEVLRPLDEVMKDGEKKRKEITEAIKQERITNMVAADTVRKALYAIKSVLSPVFFVTPKALATCVPSIDEKTAAAALFIGTQGGSVCGCVEPQGLYRANARPSADAFNANVHACLQSNSAVCTEYNCPESQ